MKNITILLLICFLIPIMKGQDIVIKVLGKSARVQKAETNGAIITFVENTNKCDPAIGFVSLEDQLYHFKEAIRARSIVGKLIPIKKLTYSLFRSQSYRFEESNRDLFDEAMEVCHDMDVIVEKVFFKLPEHSFEKEDKMAILAFRNAEVTANYMANHLGLKVKKVLNIDDDTRDSNSFFKGMSKENIKKWKVLLSSFSDLSYNGNQSKRSTTEIEYNLWVTFLLVHQ